jgi:hypothetical protein
MTSLRILFVPSLPPVRASIPHFVPCAGLAQHTLADMHVATALFRARVSTLAHLTQHNCRAQQPILHGFDCDSKFPIQVLARAAGTNQAEDVLAGRVRQVARAT